MKPKTADNFRDAIQKLGQCGNVFEMRFKRLTNRNFGAEFGVFFQNKSSNAKRNQRKKMQKIFHFCTLNEKTTWNLDNWHLKKN